MSSAKTVRLVVQESKSCNQLQNGFLDVLGERCRPPRFSFAIHQVSRPKFLPKATQSALAEPWATGCCVSTIFVGPRLAI
jgi:hypothetical protein